jgi:DcmR-like sensory protein
VTAHELCHDAFIYHSDEEFVAQMVSFVNAGFGEGASAVAVTTPRNWGLLREALGDTSREVSFTDRDQFYVRPATALRSYRATIEDLLSMGIPSVRVIGEVAFGSTPHRWAAWTSYEQTLNHALGDLPAWIVCPYDARILSDEVVTGAWRTHARVLSNGWASRSGGDRSGDRS